MNILFGFILNPKNSMIKYVHKPTIPIDRARMNDLLKNLGCFDGTTYFTYYQSHFLRICAMAHIMYIYGKSKDTKECPRDSGTNR
jgi:hypothetical protein